MACAYCLLLAVHQDQGILRDGGSDPPNPPIAPTPRAPVHDWATKAAGTSADAFTFEEGEIITDFSIQPATTASDGIKGIQFFTDKGRSLTSPCDKIPCVTRFWQSTAPSIDLPVFSGIPMGESPGRRKRRAAACPILLRQATFCLPRESRLPRPRYLQVLWPQ